MPTRRSSGSSSSNSSSSSSSRKSDRGLSRTECSDRTVQGAACKVDALSPHPGQPDAPLETASSESLDRKSDPGSGTGDAAPDADADTEADEDDDKEADGAGRPPLDASELGPLSTRSLDALRRLVRYGKRRQRWDRATTASTSPTHPAAGDLGDAYPLWPRQRRAAVLVALFGGRRGELNVLLSTRSLELRSNPGEVALPGGKMEASDVDLEATARREAFEEIGLPISSQSVRFLCQLPPFLSRSGTPLLVTPVVCLLLDSTIAPVLNTAEVSSIFSHPLAAFLSDENPDEHYVPPTVAHGTRPYRMQYDVTWLKGRPYRLFRFEGRKAPIWGFTADICIHAAMVAFATEPTFERKAKGQMKRRELVQTAMAMLLEKGELVIPKPRRIAGSHSSREARQVKVKTKSKQAEKAKARDAKL